MENLISVLEQENSEYEILLELSRKKTPVIIKGDIERLQEITDEEQNVIDRISHLEKKREEHIHDIADVINKDVELLKLENLVRMLEKSPKEQKRLSEVHDKLRVTLSQMRNVNAQNKELLEEALGMVEFDLNLLQAMKRAPETANYNKGAYSAGSVIGSNSGSFDARQ
ncbi:MAG: flagellar protein FlgN [Lachnospiraceae bacterium]|nr:flagellar protein FlgN [Lachnospiraceae bacterium]